MTPSTWVRSLAEALLESRDNAGKFVVFGAPLVMAQGGSVRHYIGAPMSPIGNADQARCANNTFSVFGPPLLLAQGASVRH